MLGCGPATDSLAWLRLLRELPSLGIPAAPLYPPPVYLAWLRPHQHLSWTPSCNELVGSQIQELSLIAPFPSTSVTHQCPGASTPHAVNTTLQSPSHSENCPSSPSPTYLSAHTYLSAPTP